VLMLLVPGITLASYDYYIPIEVYNNDSSSVSGLPVLVTLNNSQLASLGYIAASGLDTDVQEGSSSREYTVADTRLGLFLPFIDAYQSRIVNYRLGQSPAQSNFSVVLGNGGYFNVTDHNNLELGNNFSIEFEGYLEDSNNLDYPIVEGTNSSSSSGTSHIVSLPSGIASGNLLIMIVGGWCDYGDTVSWPSNWTSLNKTGDNGLNYIAGVAYKIASGSEGSNATVTSTQATNLAHQTYRISNYYGLPLISAATTTTSTNPDPPDLAVQWDMPTLWIAWFGVNDEGSTSAYPTGYSEGAYKSATNAHVGSARKTSYASSDDPGAFTIADADSGRVGTIGIRVALDNKLIKESSFYISSFGDDLVAGTLGATPKSVVAAGGAGNEVHTARVWANVTYLGIDIDGVTQNMTALSGVVVTNNTNPWQVFVPYFEYYEHYTNTTLRARYLPITMISGTTLVDRTGNGHTGTITWGSNPSTIELTIGGLQPFSSYVVPGSEDEEVPDILPVPGSITPDATAGASGQGLPLQANFQAAADSLEWSLPTTYSVMFIIVALVMGVTGLAIGSTWGFTIGFGSTSAFFGAVRDSGGHLVMPIWITVVMVMIALFIGFVWRTH